MMTAYRELVVSYFKEYRCNRHRSKAARNTTKIAIVRATIRTGYLPDQKSYRFHQLPKYNTFRRKGGTISESLLTASGNGRSC
jgi:hypothetical protein